MILYKRNAAGKPIYWSISHNVDALHKEPIVVYYGVVGNKKGRTEYITTHRKPQDEIDSLIKVKRKEGYKEITDLYDNAPIFVKGEDNITHYLNTYLPKFNTDNNGLFIPMLCKTLKDNKPFTKGTYFGQWKINGERCIITASLQLDMFKPIRLNYRSREGVDWTNKLSYMDDIILPCIPKEMLEMMVEEGIGLDGELYLPGYGINEINSFIKNVDLPQHYKLQFWLYDLCIENMSAINRQNHIDDFLLGTVHRSNIHNKEEHLNNTNQFVVLPNFYVDDFNEAILRRDSFINLGFEGLVIRKSDGEYQFGGKRNNNMLKFKKAEDGLFEIIDVIPKEKRSDLGKLVLRNDINLELFKCDLNASHDFQKTILLNKNTYIGKKALVEYRERSGIKQVPSHARVLKIIE